MALKTTHVVLIYKGSNQGLPKKYQPVALTWHGLQVGTFYKNTKNTYTKIFEKIMEEKILKFLDKNNLFNESQYGFRAGHSCLSQFLSHMDTILTHLENGSNADVIYLDFGIVFDKVDHNLAC